MGDFDFSILHTYPWYLQKVALKAEFETYNDYCKKSGSARKKEPTFFKELSNFLGDRPEAKGLDNYIDTGTSPDGEASVSEIQST